MRLLLTFLFLSFFFTNLSKANESGTVQLCLQIVDTGDYKNVLNLQVKTTQTCESYTYMAYNLRTVSYQKLLSLNPEMNLCFRPDYNTVFAVKTVYRPQKYETQTTLSCRETFSDAVVLKHKGGDFFSYGPSKATPNVQVAKNTKDHFFCLEKNIHKDDEYYLLPHHSPVIKTAKCDFKIYKSKHPSSYRVLRGEGMRGAYGASGVWKISGYDLYRFTKADNIIKRNNVTKEMTWNTNNKKIVKKSPKPSTEYAFCQSVSTSSGAYVRFNQTQSPYIVKGQNECDLHNHVSGKTKIITLSPYEYASKKIEYWSKGDKKKFDRIRKTVEEEFKVYDLDQSIIEKAISENPKIAKLIIDEPAKKIVNNQKKILKQKEFVLKEKNLDKDPPIITIAESITVNNSDYEIKGEVKDKSKKVFVLVNEQPVEVKRGKFKIKRFSPVDEKVEIIAIDQWNNRSKKTVNVKVDIKLIDVAEQLEKLDPRKIKGKRNSNAVALIIGVEKYSNAPEANYANLDAKFFAEYAKKAFGVKSSNLKLLIDQDASLVKTLSTLSKWLPTKMMEGETDLILFFAGHGLASSNGEKLYLLAQDSDTELLDRTALSREELFKAVLKFKPKSVMMFLDTCYSGVSRDEKTLLASARPIRISVKETNEVPENFTIFSASQLDQISSSIKEAKHGIFSYYLMKGLEGKADLNKDRSLTNKELLTFMKSKVNAKAVELGRQQIPVLTGNPDKVILTY